MTRSFGVFFDLRLNNGWANNREAGDWRRHGAHYDIIVMVDHAAQHHILYPLQHEFRTETRGRISNHIRNSIADVITHPLHNFNNGFNKSPFMDLFYWYIIDFIWFQVEITRSR